MSSARAVLPPSPGSLLRLLPTLFTLIVLVLAASYVRPVGRHLSPTRPQPRPLIASAMALPASPAPASPFVHTVYLVDTEQTANDLFRKYDDVTAAAGLLDVGALRPIASDVSVLVIAGPAEEASAQQFLAVWAGETAADGGGLQIIDRRAGK